MASLGMTFDPSTIVLGNLGVALQFARAGVRVFPCDARPKPDNPDSPTKRPLVEWTKEATADEDRLAAWWERWPNALVGLPAGPAGLVIIDADRHGGPDGVAAFEELAASHGLPSGPVVETLSGGRHYYFAMPAGEAFGNARGALPAGVDVRGSGGFVVAPGSEWRGRSYSGLSDVLEAFEGGNFPVLPPWLANMLRAKPETEAAPIAPQPRVDVGERERAYALAALEAECEAVARTGKGGRNHQLNTSAFALGQLVGAGMIGRAECESALRRAAMACGVWKDDGPKQCAATIRSGLNGGERNPRAPLETVEPTVFLDPKPRATIVSDGVVADAETGEVIEDAPPAPAQDDEPSVDWAGPILARNGLVSQIARWILAASRRPQPKFAIAAALSLVGTAASRHLKSPSDCHLNTYVVLMGETGSGKDDPMKAVGYLLSAAGLDELIGPSKFKSDRAVYDAMLQCGVTLAIQDEFGSTLAEATNPRAPGCLKEVLTIMRQFYSPKIFTTPQAASRPYEKIYFPCLNIIGATTPDQFWRAVSAEQSEDGTLNRMLIVRSGRVGRAKPSCSAEEPPKSLCDALKAVADRPKTRGELNFGYFRGRASDGDKALRAEQISSTQDAETMWEMLADDIEFASENDRTTSLFAPRVVENAIRIASILAIGENLAEPCVTLEHFEMAKGVVDASFRDMTRGFAEFATGTPEAARADRLIERIKQSGGAVNKRDLWLLRRRDFRNHKEFDDAIKGLVESGEIVETKTSATNGRIIFRYRLPK